MRGVKIRNKFYSSILFIFIAAQITIDNCIEMVKEGVSDIVLLQSISSLPHKIYKALKEISNLIKNLEKQTEKKIHYRPNLKTPKKQFF
jgi:hypothetical protein